ncbi:LacI family transcriptional regulator [Clostridium acetobutylicum]|uniref:Transcriptional regulators of the LacI family n=1 Tax=Clostridium acetobutylicum (strain ATCC 824 / DSM 792 / JCM 1419 / IAM 19013 / LMG 5710 / NBRC 13948 / NRRL B-527 / VKM B-1787 / 2291 / W) TaxID=272562 RepID=Q97EZ3_CLOAB|nr:MULTISPECIES: LacI family DNA-binding transcriptional regulator [Clostridium]AAK80904.1 Transcriptional regulators of the LacI family [Clostridium acetobutylicum ATCC 824]ADZ22006.1 Transcriptional regulators of the LacI family [Clostridium acetobutylicum EA 2018]AEI34494.1 LacI family transcriptional regulator [Clostridium acetobutylicum DSM 1731]AWV78684.1 LacI family transcriptional regulator [Clostridium acetobutylicum]MBC2393547.1 LacI family transcriptional regulator [Clostridium acet
MKTTILEVAKRANVSVATVSRVMNDNYPVKAETREKVLKAIKELNYIPNMQARELTQKKSATIGIVSPSISNMFFTEVINGIESYLRDKSLSLLLTCTNNDVEEEKKCITNLISRNVSGIVVISPNTSNIKNGFYDDLSNSIPFVFINSKYVDSNISSVSNDESMGAHNALKYLLKNNHKEILFVRGKDSYSYDIKEEVYVSTMKELNLFNPQNIINIGNGNSSETVDNTSYAFLEILNKSKATAAFACNDLMGVGILNACKKLNLAVPKDFSIIGYDNIALSKFVEPKLTTVDQNMFLLGTNAATLLIEKIDCNNKYSKRIILNNYIVERDTVSSI